MKQSVCLYFRIHQPSHLSTFNQNQVGIDHDYFNKSLDRQVIDKLADECYLPANDIVLSNIMRTKSKFRVNYSISGIVLELLLKYRPDVIASFNDLVRTGAVEILAETYHNSFSCLYSKTEFEKQVENHSQLIQKIFGLRPAVFRNTELLHNNEIAQHIYQLGFKGIICEGLERTLRGRSANKIYAAPNTGEFGILLRNPGLSDDIAFRYDDKNWTAYPLADDKFAGWIHSHPQNDQVINLLLDYDTLGIHKKKDTGIFNFLDQLPKAVLNHENFQFSTASEIIEQYYPQDIYDIPLTVSWQSNSEASFQWFENARQGYALKKIYSLEKFINNSSNDVLIDSWKNLQSADYIIAMADRDHGGKFLTPFMSQDAHEHYKNIVLDLEIRLIKEQLKKNKLDFIPLSPNVY
ncbi:MAG TPA: glycoside hydrolase family 57 protein [Chitinophagaceae bacterium]|jgi:alpha-amylase|nr:glycoside hydrolase family 57 protein [Chitinophagaceae bacterium]